ncbi:MAG TPA: serine--tRNA ligase [Myxococcales bacterium]|nr:serine--tRNA ligase [Myxococcales bacterium]
MLDLKTVAQSFDQTVARLNSRGGALDLGPFQERFKERRELYVSMEALNHKRKGFDEELKRKAKEDPAGLDAMRAEMRTLSQEIKAREARLKEVEEALEKILLYVPNVPHESVPVGASEADNKVERTWGEKPSFSFAPRQHFELGERLGLMDFERAAKVSGSRFVFLKGALAQLERALVAFMIDSHRRRGYVELSPPYLVSRDAMFGTGQLPKFEQDAYKTLDESERFLIPTAEVPITNYHRDEILDGADLPLRYCAYSACFRVEAGAAGKDTRGMIRQHQFHKVELVKFAAPETGLQELESLTDDAAEVLRKLGLHHRVVSLCTADLGFSSAKTYDLEVWLPGQGAFREISSCSWFSDFQARRAKIRFRKAKGDKPQLLHTLNGSGLAVGRTLIALLETGQREDGSVVLPEALHPYLGGMKELAPPPAK